jgi:uncharacterized protein
MDVLSDVVGFLDTFTAKVATTGIDISGFNLDHVAYQASTSEDYENRKPDFKSICDYQHVAMIGGRQVAVFRLKNPIMYKGYKVIALELIEPTQGQQCKSAWEHAEYVIDTSFQNFISKYPDLDWDTSSIDRKVYSHLKLRLDEITRVKFHLHDILETIKLEEKNNLK